MGDLRRAFILAVVLLLVVVTGLSILLYRTEARHYQILHQESRDVQRLEITDRAALLLAEQREEVTSSLFLPFDRQQFARESDVFQQLVSIPFLTANQEGRRIQDTILLGHQQFSLAALRLPPHPTAAQVLPVHNQGDAVAAELQALRARHTVDLSSVHASAEQQRRLSVLLIIVTNGVLLVLALAGFVLLDRLGRQRSVAATLRATDQLRRDFVAFVAHELRNPTGAIQTGISLLAEPDIDKELRQQVLESITRSADALTRLIANLLAMGRAEEGRLQLRRAPIRLDSLFDDSLEELAAYHPGIKKRVHCRLPEVCVDADAEYLKLVIANIIDNAVKYSPPRSPITVTGEETTAKVSVHIHNPGPDIPAEELSRVFDKYETSGTAPYSMRRGVGLGLYMAHLLITAHGGTMWAESQPGEGATFSFTLPRVASC